MLAQAGRGNSALLHLTNRRPLGSNTRPPRQSRQGRVGPKGMSGFSRRHPCRSCVRDSRTPRSEPRRDAAQGSRASADGLSDEGVAARPMARSAGSVRLVGTRRLPQPNAAGRVLVDLRDGPRVVRARRVPHRGRDEPERKLGDRMELGRSLPRGNQRRESESAALAVIARFCAWPPPAVAAELARCSGVRAAEHPSSPRATCAMFMPSAARKQKKKQMARAGRRLTRS